MSPHAEVETTQTIARETVASALKHNSFRSVPFHDMLYDRLENSFVGGIINAISKGKVDGIILSLANSNVAELACAWKVLALFVERYCHHTVCGVKGFFDTVAVMHIDIYVKDSLLESEKFDNAEHNI